jgi:hypothetical protein
MARHGQNDAKLLPLFSASRDKLVALAQKNAGMG